MRSNVIVLILAVTALGGCLQEPALDRHLYGKVKDVSGQTAAPLQPQAPSLVPAREPAPPLRDPTVTDTGVPIAPPGSPTPSTPAAPPRSPS